MLLACIYDVTSSGSQDHSHSHATLYPQTGSQNKSFLPIAVFIKDFVKATRKVTKILSIWWLSMEALKSGRLEFKSQNCNLQACDLQWGNLKGAF